MRVIADKPIPFALLVWSLIMMANPVAHVIRAVDHVPYAAWHPINIGLCIGLLIPAVAWTRWAWGRDLRALAHAPFMRGWPLVIVAVFAALTSPWSLAPLRSLAWAAHLLLVTLGTFVIVGSGGTERLRRASLLAVLALLTLSAAAALFWPVYGLSDESLYRGAWRGVFASKNHLGLIAALALILSVVTRAALPLRLSVAALSVVELWETRSATGYLTAASGVGVALFVGWVARFSLPTRRRILFASVAMAVAGIVAAALGWQTLTTRLGRDPSLSGRTVLWAFVIQRTVERPLLGYGLRAFFESGQDERGLQGAMNVATATGRTFAPPRLTESAIAKEAASPDPADTLPEPTWKVSYAHNGALNVALDLGVVIAALLLTWIAMRTAPALRRCVAGAADSEDLARLSLVAALLAHNLTEVSLLRSWHPEALMWTLVVAQLVANDAAV